MLQRGEGKPGRGCCAQCWTPYMCAKTDCGCHVMRGDTCRFCRSGLYVMLPAEGRPDDDLAAAQQDLLTKYGYRRDAA